MIKKPALVDRRNCNKRYLNGWPVWVTCNEPFRVSTILYRRLLPIVILGHLLSGLVCLVYSLFWSTWISFENNAQPNPEFLWIFFPFFFGSIFLTITLLAACFFIHLVNLFIGRLMTPVVACAFICGLAVAPLNLIFLPPYYVSKSLDSAFFSFPCFLIATTLGTIYGIVGAKVSIVRTLKSVPPFRIGIRSIMALIVCLSIVSAIDAGTFYVIIPFSIFLGLTLLILFLNQQFFNSGSVKDVKNLPKSIGSRKEKYKNKFTVHQIRRRFDQDVDRFSDLETGQKSTIDAPLAMELITQAAIASTSPIERVLDIGCGAGNNTIKLRQELGTHFDATFVDLSRPMLNRAKERFQEINAGEILLVCDDFRKTNLQPETYDVILAAAVLHHLRDDFDWRSTFSKIYRLLKPGGSVWITDLVDHQTPAIQKLMWERYGKYLESIDGEEYRKNVFEYIELEDSPRSVPFQMEMLYQAGFDQVEILHKNSCFAAFGAIK